MDVEEEDEEDEEEEESGESAGEAPVKLLYSRIIQ